MKILHVEPKRYDARARLLLQDVGRVDFRECGHQADLITALAGQRYEALFTRLGLACDKTVFDLGRTLRYVVTPTTGTDHIDLDEAERRGVQVISLRGEEKLLDTITSTAEHAWALLLALCRRMIPAHNDVLTGGWQREPFVGRELSGRTLGIVGCGRLGRMVARYGLAFGMRVLAHDREPSQIERAPGVAGVGRDDLLRASDFVSLHLPLDESTAGYLGREEIALMKPGAYLVNTARGELIDEDSLLEALESRALGGAALDVLSSDSTWDGEVPPRHPLAHYARTNPQLIITPHIGGYGIDALGRTRLFIVKKFLETIEGDG